MQWDILSQKIVYSAEFERYYLTLVFQNQCHKGKKNRRETHRLVVDEHGSFKSPSNPFQDFITVFGVEVNQDALSQENSWDARKQNNNS